MVSARQNSLHMVHPDQQNSNTSMIGGTLGVFCAECILFALWWDTLFVLDMEGANGIELPGHCGWKKGKWKFQGVTEWEDVTSMDLDDMIYGFELWMGLGITSVLLGMSASIAAVLPRRERLVFRMYAICGLFVAGLCAIIGASSTFKGGSDNYCSENGNTGFSVVLAFLFGSGYLVAAGLVAWNKKWPWVDPQQRRHDFLMSMSQLSTTEFEAVVSSTANTKKTTLGAIPSEKAVETYGQEALPVYTSN